MGTLVKNPFCTNHTNSMWPMCISVLGLGFKLSSGLWLQFMLGLWYIFCSLLPYHYHLPLLKYINPYIILYSTNTCMVNLLVNDHSCCINYESAYLPFSFTASVRMMTGLTLSASLVDSDIIFTNYCRCYN